jgi:hypothetical protein
VNYYSTTDWYTCQDAVSPEKAVVCLYIADHVDDKEQRLLFNL